MYLFAYQISGRDGGQDNGVVPIQYIIIIMSIVKNLASDTRLGLRD